MMHVPLSSSCHRVWYSIMPLKSPSLMRTWSWQKQACTHSDEHMDVCGCVCLVCEIRFKKSGRYVNRGARIQCDKISGYHSIEHPLLTLNGQRTWSNDMTESMSDYSTSVRRCITTKIRQFLKLPRATIRLLLAAARSTCARSVETLPGAGTIPSRFHTSFASTSWKIQELHERPTPSHPYAKISQIPRWLNIDIAVWSLAVFNYGNWLRNYKAGTLWT